jgi:hypothetical protein
MRQERRQRFNDARDWRFFFRKGFRPSTTLRTFAS